MSTKGVFYVLSNSCKLILFTKIDDSCWRVRYYTDGHMGGQWAVSGTLRSNNIGEVNKILRELKKTEYLEI